MTRRQPRRPQSTPFRGEDPQRLVRELELAHDRLDRIHTEAVTRMVRF
jgi:hypothetical protein